MQPACPGSEGASVRPARPAPEAGGSPGPSAPGTTRLTATPSPDPGPSRRGSRMASPALSGPSSRGDKDTMEPSRARLLSLLPPSSSPAYVPGQTSGEPGSWEEEVSQPCTRAQVTLLANVLGRGLEHPRRRGQPRPLLHRTLQAQVSNQPSPTHRHWVGVGEMGSSCNRKPSLATPAAPPSPDRQLPLPLPGDTHTKPGPTC